MGVLVYRYLPDELSQLNAKLLDMSVAAQVALSGAVEAVLTRDAGSARSLFVERAAAPRDPEWAELAVRLLADHQPTVADLRLVLTAVKIAAALERVRDHAVRIAQSVERLPATRPVTPHPELLEMWQRARDMLASAVDAFARGDAAAAQEICQPEHPRDPLQRVRLRMILHTMEDPRLGDAGPELCLVCRNLERVMDLATSLAAQVVLLLDGRAVEPQAAEWTPSGARGDAALGAWPIGADEVIA